MPFEIKQVSPRKWNMINTETGAIHSHRSKAKAEAHMRLLNSMDSLTGKGLIEQKYIDSLRDPSPNFSPKVPLPRLGNFEITVPPYVVRPIERSGTGKFKNSSRTVGYKLVKTLTKTRNLSSREDGVPSILLTPETHETSATVESSGAMPTLDQFSKKDQAIIKKLFLKSNKSLYLKNKQRGFPEVLPKNIERHRELGTSQLPDDFVAPPPRKRGRPKKASVAELQAQAEAQAQDMGLGDDIDFGDDETPASTPRTPKASTPKPIQLSLMLPPDTPRSPKPAGGGGKEALIKDLQKQIGRIKKQALKIDQKKERLKYRELKDEVKRLKAEIEKYSAPSPSPPTPPPTTPPPPSPSPPTPKEDAPVKKRGRPTKYGDDDEARNQSSKEQKKLSAQLIYRNSLSQEARDKYDAKQAKKAGTSGKGIQQGDSLKIKSKHNNMDSRNMFSHNLPQAETQIRASLGIMRGGNILGDIGNAFKSIPRKAAKALKLPTSVNDLKGLVNIAQIPTDVAGVKRYGKKAITYGLPAATSAALGGLAGVASAGNPFAAAAGGTMGGIAGRVAAEQINKQIGNGILGDLLDRPFTARQAIKRAKSVPALARDAVAEIRGVGVLGDILDRPFTARQAIKKIKSVPALAREAAAEIRGVGVRPAKGSQEMKDKMARLRAMRGKK